MVQKERKLRCCMGNVVFICLHCSPWTQGRASTIILSHFCQAPPRTDHTAAFKGLNEHQRQLCDFAFLSRALQPLELPYSWKAPSFPQPSFLNTPGLVARHIIVWESSKHTRLPLCLFGHSPSSPSFSLFMMHVYLPWARGGWQRKIRRQRARASDTSTACINDSVAGCPAQNIIYSSRWREITAAILSSSRKTSWPGNT